MHLPVDWNAGLLVAMLLTLMAVCIDWAFFRTAMFDSITLYPKLLERAGVTSYLGGGSALLKS